MNECANYVNIDKSFQYNMNKINLQVVIQFIESLKISKTILHII